MGAIRHLAATAAVLVLASVSCPTGFAGGAPDIRVASLGNADRNGTLSVNVKPLAPGRMRAVPVLSLGGNAGWNMLSHADASAKEAAVASDPAVGSGNGALRPSPAVSLDRRVPAAQVNDPEGISLIGLLGMVSELRHAFSPRAQEHPRDEGVARVVRTLRDSVFGKRITILSESGRIEENEPCLVGLSFTH